MILCLDSGNSRVKWGVHDGNRWLAQGAVDQGAIDGLAGVFVAWSAVTRIMLANVAGTAVAARLRELLGPLAGRLYEVRSERRRCGVSNGYADPARLGVDRWCALIGAHRQSPGPMLVVMAGTATTIDGLDGDGNFLGGFILPGLGLMRRSLAAGTAGLPLADGSHDPWPRCTGDAIAAGAIEAQAGAIERAFARLPGTGKRCLLSGGHAVAISEHLVIAHALAQNLPMEGLLALAGEPLGEE